MKKKIDAMVTMMKTIIVPIPVSLRLVQVTFDTS